MVENIWTHPATKAVKPTTTPTTSMAVRGLWHEAWNSVQCTCCTANRVPLLLVRAVGVCPGGVVRTAVREPGLGSRPK